MLATTRIAAEQGSFNRIRLEAPTCTISLFKTQCPVDSKQIDLGEFGHIILNRLDIKYTVNCNTAGRKRMTLTLNDKISRCLLTRHLNAACLPGGSRNFALQPVKKWHKHAAGKQQRNTNLPRGVDEKIRSRSGEVYDPNGFFTWPSTGTDGHRSMTPYRTAHGRTRTLATVSRAARV